MPAAPVPPPDTPPACSPPPCRIHQAWILGRWWRRAARRGGAKAVLLRALRAHVQRAMASRLAAWWQAASRRSKLMRSVLWWCSAAKAVAWAALRRQTARAVDRARLQVHWDRCALRHGLARLAAHVERHLEADGVVGAARLLATAFLSSNAMLCQKWYSMSRQRAALLALRCAGAASATLMESTGRARGRLAALRTARAFGVWVGDRKSVV